MQDIAERIAREARARHYSPRVQPMDAYDVRLLPEEEVVVFVTSTTGQVSLYSLCPHKNAEPVLLNC